MIDSSEPPDEVLRALASSYGVTVEYWDWQGHHIEVASGTVRAVLAGLGVDASTTSAAGEALAHRELDAWRRMLPPCVVATAGVDCHVWVHVPHGHPVDVWVELESGGRAATDQLDVWVEPVEVDGTLIGRATFGLGSDLPPGYHRLHARSGRTKTSAVLMVTPRQLETATVPPGSRAWGVMTQVFQARSRDSWGIGDLADLTRLSGWAAGELGADFVLVNPLHAAEPSAPISASPYLPTSRRFSNPIYLRIELIPEYERLDPAQRGHLDALAEPLRQAQTTDALIDRDAVWVAKREALQILRAVTPTPERQDSFREFCAQQGQGLLDFAMWSAAYELYGPEPAGWPDLREGTGALTELIDFHQWAQWLMDEQLAAAQAAALTSGMRIGIVHDLAVGVHPEGSDVWSLGDALVVDCSVGAPPDAFNQLGQDWSQPPWHPDRLADRGYAPFRDLVRAVLRHSGGLRVDHVMGLFRLWWIPKGLSAAQGTYVRYDHEALVGVILLEAERAGAVVVGEDLGVVEPWVRDYLADRGVLGTSITWFEKGWSDEPLAPQHWRESCLATVSTHDLPPTAGYVRGEHLAIRERLGLMTGPTQAQRTADEAERQAVLDTLPDVGQGPDPIPVNALVHDDDLVADVVVALHAQLARTPCRLLGASLADLVGDRRAVNQPGTDREYPNWCVPLTDALGRPLLLDELEAPGGAGLARRVARALNAPPAGVGRGPHRPVGSTP